jgi:hypothetical protein
MVLTLSIKMLTSNETVADTDCFSITEQVMVAYQPGQGKRNGEYSTK